MTDFTMQSNVSFMKYALKSDPGLAGVGVPHRDGDGPRTPPRCVEGVWKKFQMTNVTMPNNICLMKYALKSVPGIADGEDPHGGKDGARTPTRGSRSKKYTHHVDQYEKLKGYGGQYFLPKNKLAVEQGARCAFLLG